MNTTPRPIVLVVFLLLSACAKPPAPVVLDLGTESIRVAKSDPGDNFEDVGQITAVNGRGCGAFGNRGTYEGAIAALKNRANQLGADYVQLMTIREPHRSGDCFVNQYVVTGNAYKKVRDLPSPIPIVNQPSKDDELLQKLRTLKKMHDENLISDKEYEERRRSLLSQ